MCTGQGNQLMSGLPGANTSGSLGSFGGGGFDPSKLGQSGIWDRPFSYAPAAGAPQAHQYFDGTGPVFGGGTPPGTTPPPVTPPTTPPPTGGGMPPPLGNPDQPRSPIFPGGMPRAPWQNGVNSVGPAGPYPGAPTPPGVSAPTPPGVPPPPVAGRPGLDNNNKIGAPTLGGVSDIIRGQQAIAQPQAAPNNFGQGQAGAQSFANFASQGGMGNIALRDQIANQNFGGDQNALQNWYNTQSYGAGGQAVQHANDPRSWITDRLAQIAAQKAGK